MAEPPELMTDRAVWRAVGRGAVAGLVIGIGLGLLGPRIGLSQSPVLLVTAPVLVAVIVQLVRISVVDVVPTPPRPTTNLVVSDYFIKLRQLERRLETSTRSSEDYEWSIRPILADIINGRLLNEHGINFRTDPARARAIVGEKLWEIMISSADRPERSMSQRELTAVVGELEKL